MKKGIILIALVALLSSCNTAKVYYQICKVKSELPTTSSGAYVNENESCQLIYNFWDEGGAIRCEVYNKTNEILYVDLEKSFLIKNRFAYDYFKNRSTANTNSTSVAVMNGVEKSAIGYWSYYGLDVPGSVSVSNAKTVNSQKSYTVSYDEKPVIAIPPYSSKMLYEYKVMVNHFEDCDLYESPSKRERSAITFDAENSPVYFTNYISFRVGENVETQVIENSFFVSEVSNQHEKATLVETENWCESDIIPDLKKNMTKVFIRKSPAEFYIKYKPRKQHKSMTNVEKRIGKRYGDKSAE